MIERDAAVEALITERFLRLEELHRLGSTLAPIEALNYGLRCGTIPRWVVQAAAQRLAEYARGDSTRKVGRAAGGQPREKMDLVDLQRWNLVEELKEVGGQWRGELEELRNQPSEPEVRRRINRLEYQLHQLGKNLEDLYYAASVLSEDTSYAGSPATIKRSCRVVRNAFKKPRHELPYYCYEPLTLRGAGLGAFLDDPTWVQKFEKFFDFES